MGIPVHGNYNKDVWSLDRDGQDGNGIRLENFWQNFSSFCPCVADKITKNLFWLVFVLKIHLILSPWWSKSNSCVSKVL